MNKKFKIRGEVIFDGEFPEFFECWFLNSKAEAKNFCSSGGCVIDTGINGIFWFQKTTSPSVCMGTAENLITFLRVVGEGAKIQTALFEIMNKL